MTNKIEYKSAIDNAINAMLESGQPEQCFNYFIEQIKEEYGQCGLKEIHRQIDDYYISERYPAEINER